MFLVTPIYRGLTSTNSFIKVLLSVPPTSSTVEHAENYLESSRTPRMDLVSISWKNILDEEPFEGQHWEGVYGLPPGSTVEGWETKSLDSTPPYSPLPLGGFGDLTPSLSSVDSLSESAAEDELSLNPDVNAASMANPSSFGHRQLIEDLQRRQYWRTDWQTDASLTPSFAIKNVSSLGASFGHRGSKQLVDVLCVGPLVDLILGEQNPLGPSVPPRVVSKFFFSPSRLQVFTSSEPPTEIHLRARRRA
jgi:gamma-tubulin complex component 5